VENGGYEVRTTINMALQNKAENAARTTIRWNRGRGVNAAAFVCLDQEGRVLVDVGGLDYERNQYSRSRQSKLQPGSSFKPFVYAEAIRKGVISEYSYVSNEKLVVRGAGSGGKAWIPRNSHGGYGGEIPLQTAVAQSVNIPAVRTFMSLGMQDGTQRIVNDFGFKSKINAVPALALGACDVTMMEMAGAYSVFMLNGVRVEPYSISQVVDANGDEVYKHEVNMIRTNLGAGPVQSMDRLLRSVVTGGTGKRAAGVKEARGKTGTTNQGKSVWFCGYAQGLVGVAWCGNEYYDKKRNRYLLRAMPESFGGDIAAPLWSIAMQSATSLMGSRVKTSDSLDGAHNLGDMNSGVSDYGDEDKPRRTKRKTRRESDDTPAPEVNERVIRDEDSGESESAPRRNRDEDPPEKVTPPEDDLRDDDNGQKGRAKEPEKPEKPKTERKKPRTERNESEISVEVCADTGDRARRFCPETITRKFPRSRAPRGSCSAHRGDSDGVR
jgi:penicillin-binding protein 1A